ncbi:MAG: ribosome hibernation-promoting factor, HPF/YfiA family [Nannocystaceae bacterium]
MQTHFVFRHMESSPALRAYAEERLEKIKRYFADPLKISCTFSVEKLRQIAAFDVTLRNGLQLHASESTENLYSSVDLALAKMERQVRRYKDRIRHHKPHEGRTAKVRLGVIAAENVTDEVAEAAQRAREEAKQAAQAPIHTKTIRAERLSADQAIMQMNLMHKQFFVFTNVASGEVNVVYRLDNGDFGVIEPEAAQPLTETG